MVRPAPAMASISPARLLGLGLTLGSGSLVATSCLSPGSLDDESAFRVSKASLEAGTPGCGEACAIIQAKCTECHNVEDPAAGLDLESGDLVARLSAGAAVMPACADQRFLVPGDPGQSIIYTKLLPKPGCGLRMPQRGSLTTDEIDCIRRWTLAPSCGEDAGGSADAAPALDGTAPPPADAAPAPEAATGVESGPPVASTFYREAETASVLTDPMAVVDDDSASGAKYVSVASGTLNSAPAATTDGAASFLFDVGRDGTYTVFGRVRASLDSGDSFWVRVDAGNWVKWNNLDKSGAWVWDDVHDSDQLDATVHYDLSAGQHTVTFMYREAGAQLDKIAVSDDPTFTPTDGAP